LICSSFNLLPSLSWLLDELLLILFDKSQCVWQLASSQDIVTSFDWLLGVLVRNAAESHLVEAVLLGQAFLTCHYFDLLTDFVALLLVFVSDVLFN
jgi:hypothetical protein